MGGSFRMNKRQTIKVGVFQHDIYKQLESRRRRIEIQRRERKIVSFLQVYFFRNGAVFL